MKGDRAARPARIIHVDNRLARREALAKRHSRTRVRDRSAPARRSRGRGGSGSDWTGGFIEPKVSFECWGPNARRRSAPDPPYEAA
jgi:hypothetical protein